MDFKKEDVNICKHCNEWIDSLSAFSTLSESERDLLRKPEKVFTCTVPVKMDDGSVRRFNGYRVQYNSALGPTKGGLRYHKDVDLDEVKTLSFLMSLKTSLVNIPLGGAKGGIEVNPRQLSKTEVERLTRSFVRQLGTFIGPETDIPAPDVNTNAETMSWFYDEYSKMVGVDTPAIVTGKPIECGGSAGREKATSLGGAFVLDHLVQDKLNKKPEEIKVAIQGNGNVGSHLAKILTEWKYNVVAISNSNNGVYHENGIDLNKIKVEENNGVRRLVGEGYEAIPNSDLLELDVDVLVPAAISDQITNENAKQIKAQIILEMANSPVTKSADDILAKNGSIVIPDILANAGGVIVSYYEWLQNKSGEKWPEEDIDQKLQEQIVPAFDEVYIFAEKNNTTLRDAAYSIAIHRILAAEKKRGLV